MSSELHMMCNYNKCKKPLTTRAWVTSCSHAFCHEDGAKEFTEGENKCPACKTILSQKYDIVEVDLNPSEEFKSMVLAGMRIETIFEICSRAVAFWNYQISQQCMFHIMTAKRAKESIGELEIIHESAVGKLKSELKRLMNKISEMKTEEKNLKQRIADVNQQLTLKTQQVQKLQNKNTALKQRYVSGSISDYVEDERIHHHHHHHHRKLHYQQPHGALLQASRPRFSMSPKTLVGNDQAESCSQQASSDFVNPSHQRITPTIARDAGFHFEPDIPKFDEVSGLFNSSRKTMNISKPRTKN